MKVNELTNNRDAFTCRSSLWWTGFLLMLVGLAIPILAVEVPPLTDYPNHLARAYILSVGEDDPLLQEMFNSRWGILPNLAVDIMLPALMHIFSTHTAGRIVLALCIILPVTGTIALSLAWFRRKSFWQLGAAFVAYNALFLMGFMNFQLSVGLALWGAAGWVRFREEAPHLTVAISIPLATAMFFFHLFGLIFFALLIGSYELRASFQVGIRPTGMLERILLRMSVVGIVLILPFVLYVSSPLAQESDFVYRVDLREKLLNVSIPLLNYNTVLDAFVGLALIGFVVSWIASNRYRISEAFFFCCLALTLSYVVLPIGMKGGWWVDTRMPVLAGFMFFAVIMPNGLRLRTEALSAVVLAVLFIAKISVITAVWLRSEQDTQDTRAVIAAVSPGSRVLATDVHPTRLRSLPISRRIPGISATHYHLAAFVLLDRHAFWSHIFAFEAQQPVAVSPKYVDAWQSTLAVPPDYRALSSNAPDPNRALLSDWMNRYDFVLVMNADLAPDLPSFLPERLELLQLKGFAALFAVRKSVSN